MPDILGYYLYRAEGDLSSNLNAFLASAQVIVTQPIRTYQDFMVLLSGYTYGVTLYTQFGESAMSNLVFLAELADIASVLSAVLTLKFASPPSSVFMLVGYLGTDPSDGTLF